MDQLIICEKPSVAKTVSEALSCRERHDGYYQGNGYYVTYVFGHLMTLWDAKEYDPKYGVWKVENLPIIPEEFKYKLKDDPGVKKQFKVIKELINNPKVGTVINACDSDREGSLIGATVIAATKTTKTVKRLWISSHTPEDLRAGFANIKTAAEDAPLTRAGYCRQWADWLYGINFTVAASCLYATDGKPIKIGRVILPTLGLLYRREMEIRNFKPRKYLELIATFKTHSGEYEGVYCDDNRSQFYVKSDLDKILKMVQGKPGIITEFKSKRVSQGPPKLFNLTDLQGVITSKYDGFSAEKVLKAAQSLYEKQLITYPRTASRYLDNSLVATAQRSLEAIRGFCPGCELEFKESKNVFDSSKVDSHPALMPTYITPRENELSSDERTIYLEIVKRFAAHFAPVAEYDQIEAVTEVAGYRFKTRGRFLAQQGWKALYNAVVDGEGDQETPQGPEISVKLVERTPVQTGEVKVMEKETRPPVRYTVQTLLEAMQNCGKEVTDEEDLERNMLANYSIGTSATRAEILKKIEDSGYVTIKKKSYQITQTGISLVELFPLKEMLEPDFTGRIERQLKRMERGAISQQEFLKAVRDNVIVGIEKMSGIKGSIDRTTSEKLKVGACPKCGKDVVEKDKFYGCSGWKEGCDFLLFKENTFLKNKGINTVSRDLIKNLLLNSLRFPTKVGNQIIPVTLKQWGKYWTLFFEFEEAKPVGQSTYLESKVKKVAKAGKHYGSK